MTAGTDGGPLARRLGYIASFQVMGLLARADALERQGRRVIHMEVGEPDFGAPAAALEAAVVAIQAGRHRYTPSAGLHELRQAIAGLYRRRHGLDVDPQRVIVTPGASGALQLAVATLAGAGESVLVPAPGYPADRHIVRCMEAEPVPVATTPAAGYRLSGGDVAAHWRADTRAVLLASPANPTGAIVGPDALAAIAGVARGAGGMTIVDEIYHGLTYDAPARTALDLADDVFVVNSFSKYFGMTGWRLGWLVVPPAYVEPVVRLAQSLFLAPPTPSQYAALGALRAEAAGELEERRSVFQARRDYLVPALRRLGFGIHAVPEGAFYIYADCSALAPDGWSLAEGALDTAGVALVPGTDFGGPGAEHHVRFAYTTDRATLEEGVERLAGYLRRG